MGRNYAKLLVVPFGRQLFTTGDLDPVYIALLAEKQSRKQLARWLIAYWSFYSCGFACWASEREGLRFWQVLATAAENKQSTPFYTTWPRGAERRHFRGDVAINAIDRLKRRYGRNPEDMLAMLLDGKLDVRSVIERVKEHYLFGDWIAFKIADMLDAVWGVPIEQNDLSVFLYETPRQSILTKWQEGLLPLKAKNGDAVLEEAMVWLQEQLADCRIPHKPNSLPDWFSLETVWCKHLSHLHGQYPLLKDIDEINHGLQSWARISETAKAFAQFMPKGKMLCLT